VLHRSTGGCYMRRIVSVESKQGGASPWVPQAVPLNKDVLVMLDLEKRCHGCI
jgi:hypothetical protein